MNAVADEPANVEKRDQISELVRSPGWDLIEGRIHHELDRTRKALESTQAGKVLTATLRGQIIGLRLVLSLPEILKTEYEREE